MRDGDRVESKVLSRRHPVSTGMPDDPSITTPGAAATIHTLSAARLSDERADYPLDRRLHELVEAQVDRTPAAIALRCEGRQLSYRDLDRRANRVAHRLRALGVGTDVLVGIAMESALERIVAVLAVLKAGGAYVPLDPEYPEQRLAFMIDRRRERAGAPDARPSPRAVAGARRACARDRRGPRSLRQWEIFHPLMAGARLVLPRPGAQWDNPYQIRLMDDQPTRSSCRDRSRACSWEARSSRSRSSTGSSSDSVRRSSSISMAPPRRPSR